MPFRGKQCAALFLIRLWFQRGGSGPDPAGGGRARGGLVAMSDSVQRVELPMTECYGVLIHLNITAVQCFTAV